VLRVTLLFLASLTAFALACGGAGGAPAGTPTFTFSASGLSPRAVSVANGGCVVVRNSDAVDHAVDPDDLQTCPELLGSTTLTPAHEWDWCGFQGGPKTCGFDDPSHTLPGGLPDPAFSGAIEVMSP
jgi:hypothetical protein